MIKKTKSRSDIKLLFPFTVCDSNWFSSFLSIKKKIINIPFRFILNIINNIVTLYYVGLCISFENKGLGPWMQKA